MSLRIRRGTNAQRLTTTLDLGEIGYTTDTQKLYAGDGVSAGGRHVLASSAGNGLFFNETSQQLDLSVGALTLTTADITESSSLYFTQARAQAAVAAAFTAGQSLGNVTFSYDDTTAKIYANVTPDGVGIMSVSEDTAPVLGGNLTLGGHNIVGSGNLTVVGALTATSYTGAILLTNDNITGTGNVNITGTIAANSFKGNLLDSNFSVLVDNSLKVFYGSINTSNAILNETSITAINSNFEIGSALSPLSLDLNLTDNLQINQVLGAGSSSGYVVTTQCRGSLESPAALQAGDELGGVLFRGYTNSTTSAIAAGISFIIADDAIISGGTHIKSFVAIFASSDTAQANENALTVDSAGTVTSNAFVATNYMQLPVYANDTARGTAIPAPAASGTAPAATDQMQVFNGTTWVNAS
jgi:hypothetical protein